MNHKLDHYDSNAQAWCVHALDDTHVGRLMYVGGSNYIFSYDANNSEGTYEFTAKHADEALQMVDTYIESKLVKKEDKPIDAPLSNAEREEINSKTFETRFDTLNDMIRKQTMALLLLAGKDPQVMQVVIAACLQTAAAGMACVTCSMEEDQKEPEKAAEYKRMVSDLFEHSTKEEEKNLREALQRRNTGITGLIERILSGGLGGALVMAGQKN